MKNFRGVILSQDEYDDDISRAEERGYYDCIRKINGLAVSGDLEEEIQKAETVEEKLLYEKLLARKKMTPVISLKFVEIVSHLERFETINKEDVQDFVKEIYRIVEGK